MQLTRQAPKNLSRLIKLNRFFSQQNSYNEVLYNFSPDNKFCELILNNPQSQNGMKYDMSYMVLQQIQSWNQRINPIKIVVMKGNGDKIFSAGADIKDYYQAANPQNLNDQNANTQEEMYSLQCLANYR